MFVRLTCKLANILDGIDVTDVQVGEVFDLSEPMAAALVAEGWAETVNDRAMDAEPLSHHDST